MKKSYIFILLIILLIGCANQNEETEKVSLTISAAVSLTDALEEIKEIYQEEHDVELTFNLGGSGSLAQQIQQGAPADVFISANQTWMDTLAEEEYILADTRSDVTGNNLVLIAEESSPIAYQSFTEIAPDDVEKIAIGNPESVPAGEYTEEALRHLNIWDKLEEKLVFGKDVRQVLTYVETGNAEIGFVYESDAIQSDEIKILATAEARSHEPITYPIAVIKETKHEEAAKAFVDYMNSDEAQEILAKYGFRK